MTSIAANTRPHSGVLAQDLRGEGQLDFNSLLNFVHIRVGYLANHIHKALLAYCRKLVRHGLALLAVHNDICLAGVESIDVAGDWHDLKPIQILV
jgi:hypothetical protein